jgi:hypothetical protein
MKLVFACCLLASTLIAAAPLRAADTNDYQGIYRDLVAKQADAVVAVKFVMSMTASGKEDRVEDRTQGIVVSRDGLILIPDRAVSVDFAAMMPGGQSGSAPVAKSSDFRIRLSGSDDWLPADLVTRDSQLGLAWLRLRQTGNGLGFVNLADGVRAEPGMIFFSLMRTSDEWGGVPVFRPGRIMGETHTPRTVLLVDGVPGLAFSADGRPMGYVDIDFARLMRTRGSSGGLGLDFADMALQMTPIEKVAAATLLAAKLPSVNQGK